jgi:hypothetical protein
MAWPFSLAGPKVSKEHDKIVLLVHRNRFSIPNMTAKGIPIQPTSKSGLPIVGHSTVTTIQNHVKLLASTLALEADVTFLHRS